VPQTFGQTGLLIIKPQKFVSEIPWNISGVSDFLPILFIMSQTDEKAN